MTAKTRERNIEIYYKYKLMMQKKTKQYDALETIAKEYNLSIDTIRTIVSRMKGAF